LFCNLEVAKLARCLFGIAEYAALTILSSFFASRHFNLVARLERRWPFRFPRLHYLIPIELLANGDTHGRAFLDELLTDMIPLHADMTVLIYEALVAINSLHFIKIDLGDLPDLRQDIGLLVKRFKSGIMCLTKIWRPVGLEVHVNAG